MPRRVLLPLSAGALGLLALGLGWLATYRFVSSRTLDGWLFEHAQTTMWRSGLYGVGEWLVTPMHVRWYLLLAVLAVGLCLWRRGLPTTVAAVVVLLGANGLTQVLKPVTAQPRPWSATAWNADVASVSWPSGHATASAALVLAFVLAAPATLRPLVGVVGGLWALLVAAAVVWMGWHMPSDAVAGWCVVAFAGGLAVAGLHGWEHHAGRARARPRPGARAAQSAV